jgi:hypothetical protein
MIITPHILVGAAIGAQASNVWVVFCFGVISHYLLDILPHWDYLDDLRITKLKYFIKMVLDLVLGLIIVGIIVWNFPNKIVIGIGIGAALLPDLIQFLYMNFKFRWLRPFAQFHYKIHFWQGLSFWQGMPATLGVCLLAIVSLYDKWG